MIRYGGEAKREVSKILAASLPCTSEDAIHRDSKHPRKNSFGLMVKEVFSSVLLMLSLEFMKVTGLLNSTIILLTTETLNYYLL